MEQQAREQAFISALTTEQFVLQAARSANVGEMTGRGTIYICPGIWRLTRRLRPVSGSRPA
jgi:hypothetical protein